MTALSAEFTIGEGELMAHDVPLGCAPDEYDDLISGTCSHLPYLLGLWNAEMQLNEKGYYFAVLVLGLFSAASYQKTVRDKYEGIPTTSIYYMTCLTVFIISVALLMVGLWNATLLLSEKGFYGLAFFLSLFGAVAVQKNIRDAGINPPKETQITQEEYSE
ncbi:inner membrane protein YiaA [Escherichia coli]|nr:inner membrane protein YiaA [Escherichia coli]